MELVTLAHIKLNRIGSASASGFGFGNRREQTFIAEVADAEVKTLRQTMIEIAEANGESAGALHSLWQERGVGHPPGMVIFNIHGPSTEYSLPYAECQAFPALKIGSRYFHLEEVDTKGSTFFRSDAQD
jgi:hypothetical protein